MPLERWSEKQKNFVAKLDKKHKTSTSFNRKRKHTIKKRQKKDVVYLE